MRTTDSSFYLPSIQSHLQKRRLIFRLKIRWHLFLKPICDIYFILFSEKCNFVLWLSQLSTAAILELRHTAQSREQSTRLERRWTSHVILGMWWATRGHGCARPMDNGVEFSPFAHVSKSRVCDRMSFSSRHSSPRHSVLERFFKVQIKVTFCEICARITFQQTLATNCTRTTRTCVLCSYMFILRSFKKQLFREPVANNQYIKGFYFPPSSPLKTPV